MTKGVEQQPAAPPPEAGPTADLSGRALGDYRVLRRLGAGGMGQVYLAEQVSLRRRVALKILKADLAGDAVALQRFKREAEAVARLTHANVVQVYQIDCADGIHYMALEYVEGRNLRDHVARKGQPDAALGLSIMRQVASALQRAGELGIVHRDIKPENILLTRQGEAKVADFGLSLALVGGQPALNLTQTGVTMGTPLYMSPEQVEGKPLDPRTDIYSFGVTCYHLLTGEPPFRGQTAFEVALQHVQGEPEPLAARRPDLPPGLCAVVHKMMAKKPEDRYQTCRELLADLARLCEALTNGEAGITPTRPIPLPEPVVPPAESGAYRQATATHEIPALRTGTAPARRPRRWLPWAVAASVLLAASGGVAVGWVHLQAGARSPAGPPSAADAPEPRPLLSEAQRETFLKRAVQEYLKPAGNTPQEVQGQVRKGLDFAVELALFYLDRWRLAEADELFDRLTAAGNAGGKIPQYQRLGRLGHAIALGLQDKPGESNKLFLEEVRERERLGQPPWLRQNPKLQVWVARALDHNAENAPDQFPKELKPLQLPPQPAPARGGKPKGT
jgi:serine/threonine-protein kinase